MVTKFGSTAKVLVFYVLIGSLYGQILAQDAAGVSSQKTAEVIQTFDERDFEEIDSLAKLANMIAVGNDDNIKITPATSANHYIAENGIAPFIAAIETGINNILKLSGRKQFNFTQTSGRKLSSSNKDDESVELPDNLTKSNAESIKQLAGMANYLSKLSRRDEGEISAAKVVVELSSINDSLNRLLKNSNKAAVSLVPNISKNNKRSLKSDADSNLNATQDEIRRANDLALLANLMAVGNEDNAQKAADGSDDKFITTQVIAPIARALQVSLNTLLGRAGKGQYNVVQTSARRLSEAKSPPEHTRKVQSADQTKIIFQDKNGMSSDGLKLTSMEEKKSSLKKGIFSYLRSPRKKHVSNGRKLEEKDGNDILSAEESQSVKDISNTTQKLNKTLEAVTDLIPGAEETESLSYAKLLPLVQELEGIVEQILDSSNLTQGGSLHSESVTDSKVAGPEEAGAKAMSSLNDIKDQLSNALDTVNHLRNRINSSKSAGSRSLLQSDSEISKLSEFDIELIKSLLQDMGVLGTSNEVYAKHYGSGSKQELVSHLVVQPALSNLVTSLFTVLEENGVDVSESPQQDNLPADAPADIPTLAPAPLTPSPSTIPAPTPTSNPSPPQPLAPTPSFTNPAVTPANVPSIPEKPATAPAAEPAAAPAPVPTSGPSISPSPAPLAPSPSILPTPTPAASEPIQAPSPIPVVTLPPTPTATPAANTPSVSPAAGEPASAPQSAPPTPALTLPPTVTPTASTPSASPAASEPTFVPPPAITLPPTTTPTADVPTTNPSQAPATPPVSPATTPTSPSQAPAPSPLTPQPSTLPSPTPQADAPASPPQAPAPTPSATSPAATPAALAPSIPLRPAAAPAAEPAVAPTPATTSAPSASPVPAPTNRPSVSPVPAPTNRPTVSPIPAPTNRPTVSPVPAPTSRPSVSPAPAPSIRPAVTPAPAPTRRPSESPSPAPLAPSPILPTPTPAASEPIQAPSPIPVITLPPTPTATPAANTPSVSPAAGEPASAPLTPAITLPPTVTPAAVTPSASPAANEPATAPQIEPPTPALTLPPAEEPSASPTASEPASLSPTPAITLPPTLTPTATIPAAVPSQAPAPAPYVAPIIPSPVPSQSPPPTPIPTPPSPPITIDEALTQLNEAAGLLNNLISRINSLLGQLRLQGVSDTLVNNSGRKFLR